MRSPSTRILTTANWFRPSTALLVLTSGPSSLRVKQEIVKRLPTRSSQALRFIQDLASSTWCETCWSWLSHDFDFLSSSNSNFSLTLDSKIVDSNLLILIAILILPFLSFPSLLDLTWLDSAWKWKYLLSLLHLSIPTALLSFLDATLSFFYSKQFYSSKLYSASLLLHPILLCLTGHHLWSVVW